MRKGFFAWLMLAALCSPLAVFAQREDVQADVEAGQEILREAAQNPFRCCRCRVGTDQVCVKFNRLEITSCAQYRNHPASRDAVDAVPSTRNMACPEELRPEDCEVSNALRGANDPAPNCPTGGLELQAFLNTRRSQTPATAGTAPTTAAPAEGKAFSPITPNLNVAIPGLQFTAPTEDGGRVNLPFLAQYIAAIYRYMVGVSVIAAIVMVMWGGFRYLIGSVPGEIQRGKEIVQDAVIGMLLVLGAYVILNTINPDTLQLQSLKLASIKFIPVENEDEQDFAPTGGLVSQGGARPPAGPSLPGATGPSSQAPFAEPVAIPVTPCMQIGSGAHPQMIPYLLKMSEQFCQLRGAHTDWKVLGGGARSRGAQVWRYVTNCLRLPNSRGCSPAVCPPFLDGTIIRRPDGTLSTKDSAANAARDQGNLKEVSRILTQYVSPTPECPHERGLAVDVYCSVSHNTSRPFLACQRVLEQAMYNAGLCRLKHETWHWEPNELRVSRNSCVHDTAWFNKVQYGASYPVVDFSSCPNFWVYDNQKSLIDQNRDAPVRVVCSDR